MAAGPICICNDERGRWHSVWPRCRDIGHLLTPRATRTLPESSASLSRGTTPGNPVRSNPVRYRGLLTTPLPSQLPPSFTILRLQSCLPKAPRIFVTRICASPLYFERFPLNTLVLSLLPCVRVIGKHFHRRGYDTWNLGKNEREKIRVE